MNYCIITGGSKGIGYALAKQYHKEGYQVISLARSIHPNATFQQIQVDLSKPTAVATVMEKLVDKLDAKDINSIRWINNAGRLGSIGPLEKLSSEDISKSIQLNTIAPLILSSRFIATTKNWNCSKKIISISSGAAVKAYEGWSVYCSSKAALDMMTRCIAAEQEELPNGVQCMAIYPGVVDTQMQEQIRETDEADFKNVQRFIDLKKDASLYSPQYVAQRILKLDLNDTLKNGDIIDLRTIEDSNE